jgi:hypothetical protein
MRVFFLSGVLERRSIAGARRCCLALIVAQRVDARNPTCTRCSTMPITSE